MEAGGGCSAESRSEVDEFLGSAPTAQLAHLWNGWMPLRLVFSAAALTAIGVTTVRWHSGTASGPVAAQPLYATNFASLQEPELFTQVSSGKGTFYNPAAWGAATCGLNEWAPPGVMGTATLSYDDLNWGGTMRGCGMCIKVWAHSQGWDGAVFFVTGACAACTGTGQVEFADHAQADHGGYWDIKWQGVACPTDRGPHHAGKSPIYRLASADSRDWVSVRPMNLHYPIVAMAFGGNYEEGKLSPKFGFEWHPKSPITLPLKIRLTTAIGEVVYDELEALDKHGWVEGSRGISDHGMR